MTFESLLRNRKVIEKKHSKISGTGRECKNPFPEFGKSEAFLLGNGGNGNSCSPLLLSNLSPLYELGMGKPEGFIKTREVHS